MRHLLLISALAILGSCSAIEGLLGDDEPEGPPKTELILFEQLEPWVKSKAVPSIPADLEVLNWMFWWKRKLKGLKTEAPEE